MPAEFWPYARRDAPQPHLACVMCAKEFTLTHDESSQVLLITGVTGFIGSRLAGRAQRRGNEVRSLARREWSGPPSIPAEKRFRAAFPLDIPADAFEGVDAVVHAAAETAGGDRLMHAINVETTVRLAEMAKQAGVKTFIFLSSQSARADAASTYGLTKHEAECALLNIRGLSIVILRPGLVVGGNQSGGLFGRMNRLVKRLPVIPLLGGGKALIQPIHVDDLCDAILTCARRGDELDHSILQLGDAEGVTLKDLLQTTAIVRTGKRKMMVPIPIAPIEAVVRAAEALHVPLPVNSNSLKAVKLVVRMDTAADNARLGVPARSLSAMLQDAPADETPAEAKPVGALLVGAGRVGLVHAVTLSRLPGIVLAGLVDPNPAGCKLLHGMGVTAPDFRGLDEAIAKTRANAAVIATPPATHVALARRALDLGLTVLVEKPLARSESDIAEYRNLAAAHPRQAILSGYVMPNNPHVRAVIARLRAGEFGTVRRFLGATLLSFIQQTKTKRWEVRKDISGGGVLINAGGHVLSMIRAAFGDPSSVSAETARLFSTEVEDSAIVKLQFDGFAGTHYSSWSINGYPRQDNTLTVWTDRGRLIITGSAGAFVSNDGGVEVVHQLDFDLPFNMAPDYAGGGFTAELLALRDAARATANTSDLSDALALEDLIFRTYGVAEERESFRAMDAGPVIAAPMPLAAARVRRILDLRDVAVSTAERFATGGAEGWDGFELSVDHIAAAGVASSQSALRVTVPDFLNLSRLIAAGRAVDVLKRVGARGVIDGAMAAMPRAVSDRALTFWVAAMGMLGAALGRVPRKFTGSVMLHGYLVDFALSLNRLDMLDAMLRLCRNKCSQARIGVHSNLAAELAGTLRLIETPVDDISVLSSPSAFRIEARFEQLRSAFGANAPRLTAEVGLAPWDVHQFAAANPAMWAHGAEAVLIGYPAEREIAARRREEIAAEWTRVFPGTSLPAGVL